MTRQDHTTRALALALSAAVGLLTVRAEAQSFYRCASAIDAELALIHINGMWTETDRAKENLASLRPIVQELGHPLTAYELDLAETTTQGKLQDLWEVVHEVEAASISQFVRERSGAETPSPTHEAELERLAEQRLRDAVNQSDLQRQQQVVRSHIRRGQKVLVVAHSQGAFYANAIHTAMFVDRGDPGAEAFRVVAVGTPAPRLAGAQSEACPGGLCYTTFYEDRVVELVRTLGPEPGPLAPNTHVASLADLSDPRVHGFIGAYLSDAAGRERIVSQMQAQLDGLVAQEARVFDDVLAASLEWDSDADLDLHVLERDGRDHVSWQYPQGTAGSLDVDSLNGLLDGEDYTAYCDALEPGAYDFEVRYYEGQGPVTAHLMLRTGNQTHYVTRVLEGPGSERVPFATVDVVDFGDRDFGFATFLASDADAM